MRKAIGPQAEDCARRQSVAERIGLVPFLVILCVLLEEYVHEVLEASFRIPIPMPSAPKLAIGINLDSERFPLATAKLYGVRGYPPSSTGGFSSLSPPRQDARPFLNLATTFDCP